MEVALGITGLARGVEYSVESPSFSLSSLNLESGTNRRDPSSLEDELCSVTPGLGLSEGFYLDIFS